MFVKGTVPVIILSLETSETAEKVVKVFCVIKINFWDKKGSEVRFLTRYGLRKT
jgi:hypothetical protein